MADERREGRPVVFDRKTGLPAEFFLLSTVTDVIDELRRNELIAFAMGVSGEIPSTLRAFTKNAKVLPTPRSDATPISPPKRRNC